MTFTLISLFFLLLSPMSEARVFSFGEETVAPYINFRGGFSSMGADPYRWGSATTYSGDDVDLIYGGEFGLYLRAPMGFGLAIGVLVDTFDPVEGGVASNAAGTQLFRVDTEGLSYGPILLLDYQFAGEETYHWKFVVGGGYQFAKVENTYTLTAAGQALVGGATSITESYKAEIPFAVAGIGTEIVLSGSATISFLMGYHYALNNEWKYGQGGQNFAGSHNQEGDVVFADGTKKTIDWSYPFLQVGFNFYVDTVR